MFLERNGELRARWLGRGNQRQSLTQRLVDLLARADGPSLFENWMLSIEKLAARSFVKRIGLIDWREVPVNTLRKQLYVSLESCGRHQANLLQSLLHAELLVWLPEVGFASDDETLLCSDLDLAAFFSQLLVWDFYPLLLDSEKVDHEAPMLTMAALFEQRSDRCYLLFRSSINKLHQFLLAVS